MSRQTTHDADDSTPPPSWPGAGARSQCLDEIRNCLAPILTSAAIARSLSVVDDPQIVALDIIERQAVRLSHIVEDVLGAEFLSAHQRGADVGGCAFSDSSGSRG
ncbi:MAG: hypothetical protein ACREV5_08930 [Steroidobacter sp.]